MSKLLFKPILVANLALFIRSQHYGTYGRTLQKSTVLIQKWNLSWVQQPKAAHRRCLQTLLKNEWLLSFHVISQSFPQLQDHGKQYFESTKCSVHTKKHAYWNFEQWKCIGKEINVIESKYHTEKRSLCVTLKALSGSWSHEHLFSIWKLWKRIKIIKMMEYVVKRNAAMVVNLKQLRSIYFIIGISFWKSKKKKGKNHPLIQIWSNCYVCKMCINFNGNFKLAYLHQKFIIFSLQ